MDEPYVHGRTCQDTHVVNNEWPYVLTLAQPSDAPRISDLVNRAFSVERFFKSGDRTSPEQIAKMLGEGKFLVLLAASQLIACIYVRVNGERAYAGMLAVDPAKQKSGIGRRMMREAENYAQAQGCGVLDIRIVSVRPELQEIYTKLGFVPTGIESAEVITTATKPVHFITMAKPL